MPSKMKLHVRIVSAFALVDPEREAFTWEGDVEISDEYQDAPGYEVCERLFRVFNRVDEGDGPRLEAMGYRLPSMSVGDLVAYWEPPASTQRHISYYRVGGLGFQELYPGLDPA